MPKLAFRPKVFVSYSHRDRDLKEKFDDNLRVLKEQGIIDFWTDGEIQAGDHWPDEIANALNEANLILFLVSNHFLASSFIRNKEAPIAMVRQNRGQAVIVPIILRKTPGWYKEEWNTLQALPSQVKPVDHPDWRSPENAFAEVEERLRELIEELPQKLEKQKGIWHKASQGHEIKTSLATAIATESSKSSNADKSLSFSWLKCLGLVAALTFALGALAYFNPPVQSFTKSEEKELSPNKPTLDIEKSANWAPSILLYCRDGKTPLEGATVKASRAKDTPNASNGIEFEFVSESIDGRAIKAGVMTLEFSAVEISPSFEVGNIVVDPDAIQTNQPYSWQPVSRLAGVQDSGRTHSSIIGDRSKPRYKDSGDLVTSLMVLHVGKRGRIPAGPVAVTMKYRDKANVELLGVANFTLDIEPAGWEVDPANRKVNLYTQDGKTELDQTTVETSQRASRIDWMFQDDEYERKQFAFQLLTRCDDSLIGKALQLHVYALHARYSDEIPEGGKDMLVVSGSQRDRMKRCQLPQGTFIEIFSDQIWVVEKNAQNNKWVSFVTEREGMCPDGVHELGIICEREGEILYQSKIKVRVEDQWGLPESETKLIVRDPNRVELEKNPIITAHRLPKKFGKWDGQTSTGVRTKHSEEGLSFPLVFECKGEELEGPWCMNYYFKKPQKSGDIAIGWKALTTPTKEGYIYNSSNHFPITQTNTLSPGQVQEISTLMLWVGNDQPEHDGQGSIPPGIHDIGIEICNFKNGNWVPIYRGSVRLKVSD